jgi:hypothetical protein
MSFLDFVVWDIARTLSFLRFADTAHAITEDMVDCSEAYSDTLIDGATLNVLDADKFNKIISVEGFKPLRLKYMRPVT